MKSPITGKEMSLQKEPRFLTFRKEGFPVLYHYYLCEDSGEQFTSTEIEEVNMNQVYNQYREKHNLPFPDEIAAIRNKYNLPATKMSEVLGLGTNIFRNYENGEVPSQSNARLIQLANDPRKFRQLLELSEAFDSKKEGKILKRVDQLIDEEEENFFSYELQHYLMGRYMPDKFSGYKKPDLKKLAEMVVYFTLELKPYKTKMNKLLFYADFLHFKKTCFSMSGTRYAAIDMGPVPNNFNSIFEYIANINDVEINITEFARGTGEKFMPKPERSFNPDLFSPLELDVLKEVKARFKNSSTREIIEISHLEKGWKENFNNGKSLISYQYAFDITA